MAGAFAGLALCAMAFAMALDRDPFTAASPDVEAPAALAAAVAVDATPSMRRVYRYSIVPGGAATQAELARIVRSDKVVAAHYAGFDVDQARLATVAAPRAVYVSYRKGDKVYWTAKKVMLRAGETLLTDGRNQMRARCANRMSDVPRFPVEAHAPRPQALDALEDEPGEVTKGGITNVNAPELGEPGDLPHLAEQSFQPVWPAPGNPNMAGSPEPTRTPFATEPAAGMPWPQTGWFGDPGAPPVSGAVPLPADPVNRTPVSAPPLSVASEPSPPAVPDPGPLIPRPDPGQPVPPSNPALDLPAPGDVPEPASSWLVGAALLAMLKLRKHR